MAFDEEQIFPKLFFAGREPPFDIVPRLPVEDLVASPGGLGRQAVQVVDEMKAARGAHINGRLFQFIRRAGGVCRAEFATAEIVHAVLFSWATITEGMNYEV